MRPPLCIGDSIARQFAALDALYGITVPYRERACARAHILVSPDHRDDIIPSFESSHNFYAGIRGRSAVRQSTFSRHRDKSDEPGGAMRLMNQIRCGAGDVVIDLSRVRIPRIRRSGKLAIPQRPDPICESLMAA